MILSTLPTVSPSRAAAIVSLENIIVSHSGSAWAEAAGADFRTTFHVQLQRGRCCEVTLAAPSAPGPETGILAARILAAGCVTTPYLSVRENTDRPLGREHTFPAWCGLFRCRTNASPKLEMTKRLRWLSSMSSRRGDRSLESGITACARTCSKPASRLTRSLHASSSRTPAALLASGRARHISNR